MNQMQQMMRQAQKMQAQILKVQEEMATHREEATAGGVVTVGASGKGELLDVRIDPQALRPEDAEMLQDLTVVAANEALRKAREAVELAMKKATGGAGLPGLF
ncbi:MAG TPA: YbaB/EbfC family nucleoid-associated protein [Candidatus Methanoperedens sp.]|nr:YbaB/EbfC family nucleoid-associated protein [Candidatus Methanoperedens sp.]